MDNRADFISLAGLRPDGRRGREIRRVRCRFGVFKVTVMPTSSDSNGTRRDGRPGAALCHPSSRLLLCTCCNEHWQKRLVVVTFRLIADSMARESCPCTWRALIDCVTQDNAPPGPSFKAPFLCIERIVGPEQGTFGNISPTELSENVPFDMGIIVGAENQALKIGPGGVLSCVTCGKTT